MLYNVIGDIHGRTCWKNLVVPGAINIFVGDYFSPYDKNLSFEDCKRNFMDIVKFKNQYPDTILLLGNHDEDHWHWLGNGERMTRHDYLHQHDICELFETYKDLFVVAHSVNNQYIITHSGVSALWFYRTYLQYDGISKKNIPDYFCDLSDDFSEKCNTIKEAYEGLELYKQKNYIGYKAKLKPDDYNLFYWKGKWYESVDGCFKQIVFYPDFVANTVNEFWERRKNIFSWSVNATPGDYCGDSPTQSPMWIRPNALLCSNIFRGNAQYKQVVGHTCFKEVTTHENIVFVDCLGNKEESFKFEC